MVRSYVRHRYSRLEERTDEFDPSHNTIDPVSTTAKAQIGQQIFRPDLNGRRTGILDAKRDEQPIIQVSMILHAAILPAHARDVEHFRLGEGIGALGLDVAEEFRVVAEFDRRDVFASTVDPDGSFGDGVEGKGGALLVHHDVRLVDGVEVVEIFLLEEGEDEGVVHGGRASFVFSLAHGDGERIGRLMDGALAHLFALVKGRQVVREALFIATSGSLRGEVAAHGAIVVEDGKDA